MRRFANEKNGKAHSLLRRRRMRRKLINALKVGRDNKIAAGKVEVFNIIQSPLSRMRAAMLRRGTIVILVYDTDVLKTDMLKRNVKILKESGVSAIYHVQSLQNFEDEIVYATSLQDINEFFHTSGRGEFKSAFIAHKDIVAKLQKMDFDDRKIWSRVNEKEPFGEYSSQKSLDFIHGK